MSREIITIKVKAKNRKDANRIAVRKVRKMGRSKIISVPVRDFEIGDDVLIQKINLNKFLTKHTN